jgi:DNA-binding NarL/FixJ family response regulator
MNKDIEMLHHLAHESKQPLYHFRKYPLSDRVRDIFKRTCDRHDVNPERNLKIILDVHSGLKGKAMATKYNLSQTMIRMIVRKILSKSLKSYYWTTEEYRQYKKELKTMALLESS